MMRRIRKSLLVFVTIIFVMPSFLVTAASNDSKLGENISEEKGEISSKDEVVYAKLSATGERQETYVVNVFDVEKAGEIVDYGPYSSLKNLTDLSQLEQKDNMVKFTASEGKFYYQGNMNKEPLPWDFSVSYFLDGNEITPEEIAGKDGHVQIVIATSANGQVDPVFFENYLLQISLSLHTGVYSNIKAPDGMIANAGKNKQVTFTVMPEKVEKLTLEADVIDFELEGINITAIPFSMPIDAPNIDDMTGDIGTLTNAIEKLNNGVGELEDGVTELNNGVKNLRNGSKQYQDGMSAIDGSSSKLINASQSIQKALQTLNSSLENNTGEMDLSDLIKLEDGLVQIAGGLGETSKSLNTLIENYVTAFSTLNKAMVAIPIHEITEKEIQQLYSTGADKEVLNRLLETYSAAQKAKGTYSSVKEGFHAVEVTLQQVSGSLTEIANNLTTMASGLSSSLDKTDIANSIAQLQEGIAELSSNYSAFHSGLVDYSEGVSQLSGSYTQIHNGIEELSNGTSELETGVSKLHNGTDELYKSTSELPEQMKEEVDQMIADYDKSDFEAVSFVSPKNEKVNSVQFAIKTEGIQKEEKEESEKPEKEEKGFWDRLMELFS